MNRIINKCICILLSCFLVACIHQEAPKVKLGHDLTIGEWDLDSVSKGIQYNQTLLVLENFDVYKYSRYKGGELRKLGTLRSNDSIYSEYGAFLKAELVNSNLLRLHGGGWYKTNEFYEKEKSQDLSSNFENYRLKDSLRSQVLGWWKTIGKYEPIRLTNYDAKPTEFVLNIKDNGEANFYLNNKFDSLVEYNYRMNIDGFDLIRGEVVDGESKISFDENGNMNLKLGRRNIDTIKLARLKYITD